MFITVVGSAIVVVSGAGSLLSGLTPQLPADSIVYVLGPLGGFGGSITLAAYGYWLREEGLAPVLLDADDAGGQRPRLTSSPLCS